MSTIVTLRAANVDATARSSLGSNVYLIYQMQVHHAGSILGATLGYCQTTSYFYAFADMTSTLC